MKYVCTLFVCGLLLLFLVSAATAQDDKNAARPQRNRGERLEKFRKMALVEDLKLSEDDAVRFTAKQNAHETVAHKLMDERNGILDQLETAIKNKSADKDYKSSTEKVLDLDKKIFEERIRFQEEMRGFLTAEQYAKFLLFERRFGRQVRSAIEELHHKEPPGGGEQ